MNKLQGFVCWEVTNVECCRCQKLAPYKSNTQVYGFGICFNFEFCAVFELEELLNWSEWSRWRHHIETFPALLALCAGNPAVTVNSPHKGQWCGVLISTCTDGGAYNWDVGDLRRHSAHYDVSVLDRVKRKYIRWYVLVKIIEVEHILSNCQKNPITLFFIHRNFLVMFVDLFKKASMWFWNAVVTQMHLYLGRYSYMYCRQRILIILPLVALSLSLPLSVLQTIINMTCHPGLSFRFFFFHYSVSYIWVNINLFEDFTYSR